MSNDTNLPEALMQDLPWAFYKEYSDAQSLLSDLESYHQTNLGTALAIDTKAVVIAAAKIVIQYDITPDAYDAEKEAMELVLKADNAKGFTALELLLKLNNEAGIKVIDFEHHFFDGLVYETTDNSEYADYPGVPIYRMNIRN